ncbi:MAG TPA: DNA mismatch repair endonuclease MutL [Fimbriimonadaceae bacterium]|nr:DNA mismatch repair endonuclease MutL [Fimbriimonadaceae bacterium]
MAIASLTDLEPIPPSSEGRVLLLDPHTVNQIAAGEVVERPASVVKELVENALDAGARRVSVVLEACGRRRIEVRDDGHGMPEVDVVRCLERHATSKIRHADDLASVATLGFRGEAIPSIASVSRFRISSGTEDGLRVVIEVEGGSVQPRHHESGPRGTTVRVEDLFFNTPARLKFLKSDATELQQCLDVVAKAALMHPQVAFELRHGENVLIQTFGTGDRLSALAEVWGREVAQSLAELETWVHGVRVRGFVSTPAMTRANRAMQWIFVNGRPVRSRSLTAAIDVAYRSLTPEKRYPVAVLLLDVDPATLDINVSPTKSEVKFQHDGKVFDAIRLAIRESLLRHGMIPSAEGVLAANEALRGASPSRVAEPASIAPRLFAARALLDCEAGEGGIRGFGSTGGSGGSGVSGGWAASVEAQRPVDADRGVRSEGIDPGPAESVGSQGEVGAPAGAPARGYDSLLDGLRIIGQLDQTFILAENSQGLLIIDQHVAHERILYERIRASRGALGLAVQPLLTPETVHVSKLQAAVLREKLDELRAIGFELEPFGGESFLVRSVPADLRSKKPMRVLRDLIDELTENPVSGSLTATREEVWILASCKMAIKAGDPLSLPEMEKLLLDLAETENPYLCPHGRPITIVMDRDALMRKFKRG